MDTVFDKWKKILSDFKDSIDKDLTEIREQKEAVRLIRDEIQQQLNLGRIIRDPHRLVLSAPEIIIGNVDKQGELISDSDSLIIIRGRTVSLEGVGEEGNIDIKAPTILQNAVNPGADGEENVVESISQIISQAKTINLTSSRNSNIFLNEFQGNEGGVFIHADAGLVLDASSQAESRKKLLEEHISELESQKSEEKSKVNEYKKLFEDLIKEMENTLKEHDGLLQDGMDSRANIGKVFELNDKTQEITTSLTSAFSEYSKSISRLADTTWKISKLKEQKDNLVLGEDFKTKQTGSKVLINGELVDIISKDGEGNYRENPGAGINLTGNSINLGAISADGSLTKNGDITLSAMNLTLSSLQSNNISVDDKGIPSKGVLASDGALRFQSKDIAFESLDYEITDSDVKEKSLTKDSRLTIRTEKIDISTNDTEGKATGEFAINSKSISLKSMDLDKEKRSDKSLSQGGAMLLISEKMFVGGKDKDTESKLVQLASETVGTFVKTTFEVQQGEKKSILQMDGGKMSLCGESTGVYGKTTINDATEIKGELKAPKASIDSIEAKSSFKSPNISDGMAASSGGGGGSLSTKLTQEEAPKSENS